MRKLLSFLLLFVGFTSFSQTEIDFEAVDSLYREDQFYFGTTYNILRNKPGGVSQNSFSAGVNAGFLRDFPLNKNRTFSIAPGIGFSFANFKQNIVISETGGVRNYSLIAQDATLDKNKLAFYAVDLPIEFRWRTSTFESHKFWRIYTGLKASYIFYNISHYKANDGNFKVKNNPDINKLQYGAYVATGYNTFNLYAYYGFSDLFKKGILDSDKKLSSLNIGLMFYIL